MIEALGAGKGPTRPAEEVAAVGDAVIGHHAAHDDAVAAESDERPGEEAGTTVASLVVQDVHMRELAWSSMQTWTNCGACW